MIQLNALPIIAQDNLQIQEILAPSSILKVSVVGLAGEKAILAIGGKEVLADSSKVPLTAGEVLTVEVQKSGDQIELKILSSSFPKSESKPASLSEPPQIIGAELQSHSPSLQAETFLQSLGLPLDPELLNPLKLFFQSILQQQIPQENLPFKVLQAGDNPAALAEVLPQVADALASTPESKLVSLAEKLSSANGTVSSEEIQNFAASIQHSASAVSSFSQSHQIGNAVQANQTPSSIFIPIPFTLDGKSWIGYLEIESDDLEQFGKKLQEGSFTLKFTVTMKNLGSVQVKVAAVRKKMETIFFVRGGEEKLFIENHIDKLLERLRSLPFASEKVRVKDTGEQKKGVNSFLFKKTPVDVKV